MAIYYKQISQQMKKTAKKNEYLFLVEGETEIEFYSALLSCAFPCLPKKIKNLKGNFNINNKILDKCFDFASVNEKVDFEVFICIDRERTEQPPYNKTLVNSRLREITRLKGVHEVIAVLMIESLFFIDIEGIYKYLGTKRTLRNNRKYSNFRKLTHSDLNALFKQSEKTYIKGRKSSGLINSLNLNKIVSKAEELQNLIYVLKQKGN